MTEIMGNRSNVILVGGDGTVLGAIKLIGPRQSRLRKILPHAVYEPPPPQARAAMLGAGPKIDPLAESGRDQILQVLEDIRHVTVRDALVGLVQGCGPSIANDIARRAGLDGKALVEVADPSGLVAAIGAQYDLLRSRAWSPVIIYRGESQKPETGSLKPGTSLDRQSASGAWAGTGSGVERCEPTPVDFRAYAEPFVDGARPAPSMSAAIEMVSEGLESSDALRSGRRRVREALEKRRTEVESRLASLQRGLEAAERADSLRDAGNLVLGFQYQIQPGDKQLDLPDTGLTVDIDPTLTPVENAERYFKRYRKAREAGKKVPGLIEAAKHDLDFVEELDAYVDLAESPADLNRLESELADRFGSKAKKKVRLVGTGRPLTVDLGGGTEALVGRSARQNEEVTFKLAGRGDLWLHARGFAGAHVVVRDAMTDLLPRLDSPEGEPIRLAAALAAYFSKARNEGAADVIVARVRDVHRIPGGAPGQVTVRESRTIRVRPLGRRRWPGVVLSDSLHTGFGSSTFNP